MMRKQRVSNYITALSGAKRYSDTMGSSTEGDRRGRRVVCSNHDDEAGEARWRRGATPQSYVSPAKRSATSSLAASQDSAALRTSSRSRW